MNLPPPPGSDLARDLSLAVQAARDEDHLKLLEIGFFIVGVTTALRFIGMLFIMAIMVFGGVAASLASRGDNSAPPAMLFLLMAGAFGSFVVLMLIFAVLEVFAGICLRQRRHAVLIQIVAAVNCISIPWGTALGVATFMVLNRPSVKALFATR